MKEIFVIYHFQSSPVQEDYQTASYKMIYAFDQEEMIKSDMLLELLKAYPDSNYQDKSFLNLDDLKAFAMRLGEELTADQVRLISVQDFNIGIDGAKDFRSFQQIFGQFGEVLINQQLTKKKGIFSKLFS